MKPTIIAARLDDKTHSQLKDFARREDRSVSWVVRRADEEYVGRSKKRTSRA